MDTYEKKYNEAMLRADEAVQKGCLDKYMFDIIFPPEESEDERIRKVIYKLMLGMREEIFTSQDEIVTKEKVLAYLEKQKINTEGDFARGYDCGYESCLNSHGAEWFEKQKENPKTAISIPADCASDAKCGNSRHKVGDSPEGRRLADEVVAYLIKFGYQPIIKDTLDQKHFQIKIPRHKEDFFHSKEYKHCREILGEYYYEGDFAGDVYTLYVLRQKEQKPVEWSEEDTEMYINVASSLRGYACGLENEEHKRHIKKGLDWLENRFQSLRPTKDCNGCPRHLEGYISGRSDAEKKLLEGYGILWTPEGELRMKPRWKPSEEQMKLLLNIEGDLRAFQYNDKAKALAELYEQLKRI